MSSAQETHPVELPHLIFIESRQQQQQQQQDGIENLQPTILSLPPELICKIFISLPTTTSILPLLKSCKQIYLIWLSNAIQICRGRMSSYWASAEKVALLQRNRFQGQDLRQNQDDENHHQLANRLLRNELIVTSACERFSRLLASGQCFPYYLRDSSVTAKEDAGVYLTRTGRERFHGAYYRYWIDCVRGKDGVVGDGEEAKEEEGGMKHQELDLRTLFVKDVFLKKRR